MLEMAWSDLDDSERILDVVAELKKEGWYDDKSKEVVRCTA
jgi:hypothetical protein